MSVGVVRLNKGAALASVKLNGDVVPQVRRMTGALVAVGRGRLSVPQLKEILEARDSLAYPQGLAAPASGLFLTRVDYRDTGEQVETEKKLGWEQK